MKTLQSKIPISFSIIGENPRFKKSYSLKFQYEHDVTYEVARFPYQFYCESKIIIALNNLLHKYNFETNKRDSKNQPIKILSDLFGNKSFIYNVLCDLSRLSYLPINHLKFPWDIILDAQQWGGRNYNDFSIISDDIRYRYSVGKTPYDEFKNEDEQVSKKSHGITINVIIDIPRNQMIFEFTQKTGVFSKDKVTLPFYFDRSTISGIDHISNQLRLLEQNLAAPHCSEESGRLHLLQFLLFLYSDSAHQPGFTPFRPGLDLARTVGVLSSPPASAPLFMSPNQTQVIPYEKATPPESSHIEKVFETLEEEALSCPIRAALMENPRVAMENNRNISYEYEEIIRWINGMGQGRDPTSKRHIIKLIPNNTLKLLIAKYHKLKALKYKPNIDYILQQFSSVLALKDPVIITNEPHRLYGTSMSHKDAADQKLQFVFNRTLNEAIETLKLLQQFVPAGNSPQLLSSSSPILEENKFSPISSIGPSSSEPYYPPSRSPGLVGALPISTAPPLIPQPSAPARPVTPPVLVFDVPPPAFNLAAFPPSAPPLVAENFRPITPPPAYAPGFSPPVMQRAASPLVAPLYPPLPATENFAAFQSFSSSAMSSSSPRRASTPPPLSVEILHPIPIRPQPAAPPRPVSPGIAVPPQPSAPLRPVSPGVAAPPQPAALLGTFVDEEAEHRARVAAILNSAPPVPQSLPRRVLPSGGRLALPE